MCRGDPKIALANVRTGIDAVCTSPETIREHLPKVPFEQVVSLPDKVRAVIYAGTRLQAALASDKEIARRLDAIRLPREEMLAQAALLARRKLVDASTVARIRAGTGPLDMARDGLALHALFTDPESAAKLKGQHPFTDAELTALRDDSEWLIENLIATGTPRKRKERRNTPEDDRDRLWSLVVRDHVWLRKIGHYFHDDAVDEYVPRLLSRVLANVADEEGEDAEAPATDDTPEG